MLNVDMLFMKMSRCTLHYDKIAQIDFLTDPYIKASKISNFKDKYLRQFWAQKSETFRVIFVRMRGSFY